MGRKRNCRQRRELVKWPESEDRMSCGTNNKARRPMPLDHRMGDGGVGKPGASCLTPLPAALQAPLPSTT